MELEIETDLTNQEQHPGGDAPLDLEVAVAREDLGEQLGGE